MSSERPKLFLVDNVPVPYDKADYKAVTTDAADWKEHRIPPGIYVVRRYLRPFYTRSLLLHELIHTVAARPNPSLLGRGLEEGLAELVGSMYLTSKVLGKELAANIFTYTRLRYGFDQFWELYLDYTRQATYLYNTFGLDGIVAILQAGRATIKHIEIEIGYGNLSNLGLPSGGWDDDLTYVANSTTMVFCRNLVVSPLAKYLLPFVLSGESTADILATANVELDEGFKALEELQSRIVLAVFSEGSKKVSFSDAQLLASTELVRYEIPA